MKHISRRQLDIVFLRCSACLAAAQTVFHYSAHHSRDGRRPRCREGLKENIVPVHTPTPVSTLMRSTGRERFLILHRRQ